MSTTDAWCPGCRERVSADGRGRCLWCGAQTAGAMPLPGPQRRKANAGRPYLMDEQTLEAARSLVARGLTMREASRRLHARTGYPHPESLRHALRKQFRWRGWRTGRMT